MGVTLNPPTGNTGMGMQTGNIWMNAAAGAASGVFDRLAQRIGVNYDQRKQYEQQKKLNDLQIMSESKLMDIQNQKQLEMWKATSYPAQVKMLQEAGLNPALLYGQAGGGGTTGAGMPGAMAGTAQSPNTHAGGMGIMQSAMMAGQMGLLDAQRKNIEADTKNKEADTKSKLGETKGAIATIENLIANTKNSEAQTELTRLQSNYQKIVNTIKDATSEQEISNIKTQATILMQEMRSAMAKGDIDTVTKETTIRKIGQELTNAILEGKLISAQTDEARQEIANLKKELEQMPDYLANTQAGQTEIKRHNEKIEKLIKAGIIAGAAGDVLKGIIDIYTKGAAVPVPEPPKRNPIGFK